MRPIVRAGLLEPRVIGGGGGGLVVTQLAAAVARTSGSAALTTASFSATNGGLLIVGVCYDNPGSSGATLSNSGTAFTYTQRQFDVNYSSTKIFTAPVTATQSMTVTSAASSEKTSLFVWHVTGQHASPIGTGGAAGSSTNAINPAYTPTAATSVLFVVASEWLETGTPTSSNLTNTVHGNHTGYTEAFYGRKASVSTAATSFNLDAAGTGGTNWSYCYQEILAA